MIAALAGPDSSDFNAKCEDGMRIFDYGSGTIDLSHIASNRLTQLFDELNEDCLGQN